MQLACQNAKSIKTNFYPIKLNIICATVPMCHRDTHYTTDLSEAIAKTMDCSCAAIPLEVRERIAAETAGIRPAAAIAAVAAVAAVAAART